MFRYSFILVLAITLSACANRMPSAVRQAEFASEHFDVCTLTSPEETWAYWDIVLSDESKETVITTPYDDLIKFHFGWGMGIRNDFCLWKGGPLQKWFATRGIDHPDNMSGILISFYWAHINGCRPDADSFVRGQHPDNGRFLHCPEKVEL